MRSLLVAQGSSGTAAAILAQAAPLPLPGACVSLDDVYQSIPGSVVVVVVVPKRSSSGAQATTAPPFTQTLSDHVSFLPGPVLSYAVTVTVCAPGLMSAQLNSNTKPWSPAIVRWLDAFCGGAFGAPSTSSWTCGQTNDASHSINQRS